MKNELTRIFDLHRYQLENYPKEDSLMAKVGGKWQGYSTALFIETAGKLSAGLHKLNLRKGDKVGMISNNRPEWHIADLAMLQLGIVIVPVYPTITEEDYAYMQ